MAITRLARDRRARSSTSRARRSGKLAKRNAQWLYYNGGRYWNGYKKAVPKYSLAVLFSSFLMGEIAAATIFHQMAAGCSEPVFKEAIPQHRP